MSYLSRSRSPAKCYPCDIFFKTWDEKREHDKIAHDRYSSTDSQRYSWDQNRGNMTREEDDYFVCGIHAKKINDMGRCPVTSCSNGIHIRKSLYVKEMQSKINS